MYLLDYGGQGGFLSSRYGDGDELGNLARMMTLLTI